MYNQIGTPNISSNIFQLMCKNMIEEAMSGVNLDRLSVIVFPASENTFGWRWYAIFLHTS
jgi:type III secretory pathway lipoprotein EscJ